MSLSESNKQKLAAAALRLAARTRWKDLALADIAAAAGVPLSKLYGSGGKIMILASIESMFDRASALEANGIDRASTPRDRLFDASMRRFEAMEAYRDGLVSIDKEISSAPSQLAIAATLNLRSAHWLMVIAGLDHDGPMGVLKTAAFLRTLNKARQAWREDEHGDLSRTMAALDRGLRDLETRFPHFGQSKPNDASSSAEAS